MLLAQKRKMGNVMITIVVIVIATIVVVINIAVVIAVALVSYICVVICYVVLNAILILRMFIFSISDRQSIFLTFLYVANFGGNSKACILSVTSCTAPYIPEV